MRASPGTGSCAAVEDAIPREGGEE
jgi:hypothetical protein